MRMRVARIIAALTVACGVLSAAPGAAPQREFTLNDRIFVSLTPDWTERRDVPPPPPPLLAASAPRLRFSDILVLENRSTPGVIELALSDNPYLGSDGAALQTRLQINAGAVPHFFYFFFPPPRPCLAKVRAAFDKARRDADEQRERDTGDSREKKKSSSSGPPAVSISGRCDFGPEPRDFFAEQISPGLTFSTSGSSDRVEGQLRKFFLATMEQHEIGEMTFFIFEAQAERIVSRDDVEKFGFPDAMDGARVHYFWAIGARTPFPFLRDPQRKDLQLAHLVYATLSPSGDARPLFLDLLRRLRFAM